MPIPPMKIFALLTLLVTGCATTAGDMSGAKVSWQGATYDEVVSRWGIPNNHTTLSDGRYVYSWESEGVAPRGVLYPSIGLFGGSGGVGISTGVGIGSSGGELVRCSRTLIFRDARVVEQIWQGPPDFCNTFGR